VKQENKLKKHYHIVIGTDNEEAVYRTKIVLEHLSKKGTTAYFTTHKHEIAEYVKRGKILGAMNLAVGTTQENNSIKYNYNIIRNAHEKSYGNLIAEGANVTEKILSQIITNELSEKRYQIDHTRIKQYAELNNKTG